MPSACKRHDVNNRGQPMKEFYAHSVEGKPPEEWHRLEDHLKGTAALAKMFADEFGCGEWGCVAGLCI